MKKKQLLAICLASIMLLSACGKKEEVTLNTDVENTTQEVASTDEEVVAEETTDETSEESTITTEPTQKATTILELKQQYGVADKDYIKPFYNVEQNTQFTFHFNSKVEPIKAVTVHTDPSCNVDSTVYQINSAYINGDGYDIVVKPGRPVLNSSDRAEGELPNYNWGNAPVYYLSINYDMDASTPTALSEPIVVPFTVKRDISTPNLEASISRDGSFTLTWKPVDNAVKYNVYEAFRVRETSQARNMTRSQAGYVGDHLELLATVDGNTTTFDDFHGDGSGNTLESEGYVITQNFFDLGSYYVTAVDANGNESSFSMGVEGWKYAGQLPNTFDAWSYISKGSDGKAYYLPDTVPVQMLDKSIHYYPINYTKIKEYTEGYATYEYNIVGTKLSGTIDLSKEDKIYAPSIESTTVLSDTIYEVKNDINIIPDVSVSTLTDERYDNTIMSLDKEVSRDESTAVKYSQDALNKRADIESARIINDGVYTTNDGPLAMLEYGSLEENGTVTSSTSESAQTEETKETETSSEPVQQESETSENTEVPSEITSENLVEEQIKSTESQVNEANNEALPDVKVMYFADSAEEEYLALNLIAANPVISLEAFPNLQNQEYLLDVFQKVYYQNPYILHTNRLGYIPESNSLVVEYTADANTIYNQQESIAVEAANIVNSVITDDMSDEEKVMAIWNYFEEHTEYDTKALEAAEANNFETDGLEEFDDSFSTYGIMCKKVGVCQSYAYCYKLLLGLCDVPCITLTGYMDQTLPHAWNAVYLDGAWRWIDATNNATNCGLPYLLYQTSSTYAEKSNYTLSDFFELNTNLLYVSNEDNSKDWYVENNCFATSESELVQMVADNYDNFDKYVCVKSEFEPELDEDFMIALLQALIDKGLTEDEILNMRMGYTNGIFVLIKS